MGNGTEARLPYHQMKKAICLSESLANEAPATILHSLGWGMINMLVGPGNPDFREKAGNPGEALDPKHLPPGIIPALEKAKHDKVPGAADALRFAEAARDLMKRVLTDKESDHNDTRRAAQVMAHLLRATLAVFP